MQKGKSIEEQALTSLKLIVGRQSESFQELTSQLRFVCSVMHICSGALSEYKSDYVRLASDLEGDQIRAEMVAIIEEKLSTMLSRLGPDSGFDGDCSQ